MGIRDLDAIVVHLYGVAAADEGEKEAAVGAVDAHIASIRSALPDNSILMVVAGPGVLPKDADQDKLTKAAPDARAGFLFLDVK